MSAKPAKKPKTKQAPAPPTAPPRTLNLVRPDGRPVKMRKGWEKGYTMIGKIRVPNVAIPQMTAICCKALLAVASYAWNKRTWFVSDQDAAAIGRTTRWTISRARTEWDALGVQLDITVGDGRGVATVYAIPEKTDAERVAGSATKGKQAAQRKGSRQRNAVLRPLHTSKDKEEAVQKAKKNQKRKGKREKGDGVSLSPPSTTPSSAPLSYPPPPTGDAVTHDQWWEWYKALTPAQQDAYDNSPEQVALQAEIDRANEEEEREEEKERVEDAMRIRRNIRKRWNASVFVDWSDWEIEHLPGICAAVIDGKATETQLCQLRIAIEKLNKAEKEADDR